MEREINADVQSYPDGSRTRHRAWVCAALLACVSATASAGERIDFRSRFYDITTDVDQSLARQIGEQMDLMFAEYAQRFRGFAVQSQASQPLYLFSTERDYQQFLGEYGIDGRGSGGMFFVMPKGSGLASYVEGQSLERMFHTLRHEGFHQFAYSRIGPKLPTWVNEGLAEFFAESIVVGRGLQPGQVPMTTLRILQDAAKNDRHIPFETLLNLSGSQWAQRVHDGQGAMQYAESWSIVHLLVQGDRRYQDAFTEYLHAVARGIDNDRAFIDAFGRNSYEDFEGAWKRYLANLHPSPESTAARRLEFMGRGIRWLRERGEKPESLDQLKTMLRKHEFGVKYSAGHGPVLEMRSADEENFEPPVVEQGKKAVKASIEWLTPAGDLPPGLVVKGLKVPVRLAWQIRPGGDPISRIVYDDVEKSPVPRQQKTAVSREGTKGSGK